MIYAVSDLHGCFKSWLALLEKLRFSDDDLLYVVGDVVDRGPQSMALLLDLSQRFNVIPIAGNHDLAAAHCLSFLSEEVTDASIEKLEQGSSFSNLMMWLNDGGRATMEDFRKLDRESREIVLDYFQEFSLYEEAEVGGVSYVLAHAGVDNFSLERSLEDYPPDAFSFARPDYDRCYFPDRFLITGHTPTRLISGAKPDFICRRNNHIAIDCGCVYGGQLGAFCLDNGQTFYVANLDH